MCLSSSTYISPLNLNLMLNHETFPSALRLTRSHAGRDEEKQEEIILGLMCLNWGIRYDWLCRYKLLKCISRKLSLKYNKVNMPVLSDFINDSRTRPYFPASCFHPPTSFRCKFLKIKWDLVLSILNYDTEGIFIYIYMTIFWHFHSIDILS